MHNLLKLFPYGSIVTSWYERGYNGDHGFYFDRPLSDEELDSIMEGLDYRKLRKKE